MYLLPQTSLLTQQTMDESMFSKMVVDLLVYRANNPHSKPDSLSQEIVHNYKEKQVFNWIVLMNNHRKELDAGNSSMLTPKHVRVLDDISFPWEISHVKRWDTMFKELQLFAEKKKHCKVPRKVPKLGEWVCTQRKEYEKYLKGDASSMNVQKIELLESVGFIWKVQYTWEERLVQLAEYQEANGHCRVPVGSSDLGRWVKEQRAQKKNLDEGSESNLTLDQVRKLDSLGFEWVLKKKRT